jgi:hypothetical protein
MVNFIKYLVLIYIKNGLTNIIIIVGIILLYSILLSSCKFLILYVVGELKINLIFLVEFVRVKCFGLLC